MFGERYFALRERLAELLKQVRELQKDVGLEEDLPPETEALLRHFRSPLMVLVCGETNAGKSMVINGLFGPELCETNKLPCTKSFHWFRYGEPQRDEVVSDFRINCYRKNHFLKSFAIVDSPGLNSPVPEHRDLQQRFCRMADVILCVFPVSNPWSPSTWDLIAKLPREDQDKLLLVLQQKDLREEQDVAVMLQHMQQLSLNKVGRAFTTFPVSAEYSFYAKSGVKANEALWRVSGFAEFEDQVSHAIESSPKRQNMLRETRDWVRKILRQLEMNMDQRSRSLAADQGFLSEISREIDNRREGCDQILLSQGVEEMRAGFREQCEEVTALLQRETRPWHSLKAAFENREVAPTFEKNLTASLQDWVSERIEVELGEVKEVCRHHWEKLEPKVQERLGLPLGSFEKAAVSLDKHAALAVERSKRVVRRAVFGRKLKTVIEHEMRERQREMQRLLMMVLGMFSIAGLLGILKLNYPAMGVVVAGIVALFYAMFKVWRSRGELVEGFLVKAERSEREFGEQVVEFYRDEVRSYFGEYSALFVPLRGHVVGLKNELRPQLDRWNELYLETKSLSREFKN